jgi:hypothetical protein
MTFALTLAAIRRHPFSFGLTALLLTLTASLTRSSVALAVTMWLVFSLVGAAFWYALEPTILRRLAGFREPTLPERQRIELAIGRSHLRLLIADTADLVAARGLRCLVVTRDLMDVFEDRALTGLLNQTVAPMQAANLAGFGLIWLGNLPVLGAWVADRFVTQLARMLAVVVGTSLVLPLVLCRNAFLCWTGRLLTAVLVGLTGSVLISVGHAAAGLGILLAWLVVPTIQAILAWESRRVEASADSSTIAAGFGPQLLEAVDFLSMTEPLPVANPFLGVLRLPRSISAERAEHIRRVLGTAQTGTA